MKKYYSRLKKYIYIGAFFKFLEAMMEVTLPLLMGVAIASGKSKKTATIIIFMLSFVLLGYAFAFVCQKMAAIAQSKISTMLREDIFAKALEIDKVDAGKIGSKKTIMLVTNDTERVALALAMIIRIVPRTPFIAIGSMVMLFILNVKVALLFVLLLPFLAIFITKNTKKILPQTSKNQKILEKISQISRETAEGIFQIHAGNLEDPLFDEFEMATIEHGEITKKINKINSFYSPATTLFINVSVVLVLYFALFFVKSGEIDIAYLSSFITYMLQMGLAVSVLVATFGLLSRGYSSYKRIEEFLEIKPKLENENTIYNIVKHKNDEIALLVEDFSLVSKGFHLEKINLEIKIGEKIGIVGKTGSGKSLFLEGITRSLENSCGNVEILGKNFEEMKKSDIFDVVGVISQKAVIYSGTVDYNLKMGKVVVEDERALQIKKVVCPFVFEKEQSGNDFLAEGGSNLSGGQKQRISIARTLFSQKEILFCDDCFSALDTITAKAVREFVFESCKSILIVSQKIADVEKCDMIYVLEEGKVVDKGNHEQLLASSEIYKEMQKLQGGAK